MAARIVDCNVWLTSAGKSEMPPDCRDYCEKWLWDFWKSEDTLVMDLLNCIGKEYRTNFKRYGVTPQDMAWQILNSLERTKTRRISEVLFNIDENGHAVLPDDFLPDVIENSDKKWIAAHLAHPEKPVIFNASDTDWLKAEKYLNDKKIPVINLCVQELREILERREAG